MVVIEKWKVKKDFTRNANSNANEKEKKNIMYR